MLKTGFNALLALCEPAGHVSFRTAVPHPPIGCASVRAAQLCAPRTAATDPRLLGPVALPPRAPAGCPEHRPLIAPQPATLAADPVPGSGPAPASRTQEPPYERRHQTRNARRRTLPVLLQRQPQ